MGEPGCLLETTLGVSFGRSAGRVGMVDMVVDVVRDWEEVFVFDELKRGVSVEVSLVLSLEPPAESLVPALAELSPIGALAAITGDSVISFLLTGTAAVLSDATISAFVTEELDGIVELDPDDLELGELDGAEGGSFVAGVEAIPVPLDRLSSVVLLSVGGVGPVGSTTVDAGEAVLGVLGVIGLAPLVTFGAGAVFCRFGATTCTAFGCSAGFCSRGESLNTGAGGSGRADRSNILSVGSLSSAMVIAKICELRRRTRPSLSKSRIRSIKDTG